MAAFVELDAAHLGEVSVLDVDQAGGDAAAEYALGGASHRCPGLSGADYIDVAEFRIVARAQPALHRGRGIGGSQRRAKNRECVPAQKLIGHLKIGSARMAATVSSGSSVVMATRTSARPYCFRRVS